MEGRYAFLSYSRADQAFAARLAADLRSQGIHLWFDQLDISPGVNWDEAIHKALQHAQAVVFVVSTTSVVSENVLNELHVALEGKKWIIPIVIVARRNTDLAELLAHLAEVEARGIHRQRACASLYTYCVYELRMSEDEAYRRAKAARLVRQFPELFERIAHGELHLTGLLLLGPQLDCEHRREILDYAQFRSKRELQELVARLDPKPESPASVEPVASAPAGPAAHRRFVQALAPAIRSLPAGERPADWIELEDDGNAEGAEPTAHDGAGDIVNDVGRAPSSPAWLSPVRFEVKFTATREHVEAMNEALDLLSHELPARDIAELHARATTLLVAELRKKKCAATDRPRPKANPRRRVARSRNRHISAEVRREVWTRDDARCCYRDEDGRRCAETTRLELHHRVPYAHGGPHIAENLELRCRSHNDLAAEQDFGRDHVASQRGVPTEKDPRRPRGFERRGRFYEG